MYKIVIAEDHKFFRESLSLVCKTQGFHVLFLAVDGVNLEYYLNSSKNDPSLIPDIILMDISMPRINGITATVYVARHFPSINVIALSIYAQEKPVLDMLRSGAKGFIDKGNVDYDEILLAINAVMCGEYYISPSVLEEWKIPPDYFKTEYHKKFEPNLLNKMEYQFLSYCGTELGYKEIAEKMGIKVHTANNYSAAVFEKLNIHSRAGLVIYAIKHGLTEIYHPESLITCL